MTGERYHASDDGSLVRSTSGAAARGAMLIAVAIIIGLVLLMFALDDPATVVEASPGTEDVTTDDGDATADAGDDAAATDDTADAGDDTGSTGQEAVDPAEVDTSADDPAVIETDDAAAAPADGEARQPAEVNVLVANGTGEGGVAGSVSDKLKRRGYLANAANAPSTANAVIFYREGYAADAREVATILGAVATVIQPAPANIAVNQNAIDDGRLAEANVVVIIGADGLIPTA